MRVGIPSKPVTGMLSVMYITINIRPQKQIFLSASLDYVGINKYTLITMTLVMSTQCGVIVYIILSIFFFFSKSVQEGSLVTGGGNGREVCRVELLCKGDVV